MPKKTHTHILVFIEVFIFDLHELNVHIYNDQKSKREEKGEEVEKTNLRANILSS